MNGLQVAFNPMNTPQYDMNRTDLACSDQTVGDSFRVVFLQRRGIADVCAFRYFAPNSGRRVHIAYLSGSVRTLEYSTVP